MHFRFGTAAIRNAGTAFAIACAALASPARAQAIFGEPIGTFASPVQVAVAPGKSRLLFVVEIAGRIQVLRNGTPRRKPFLDIARLVLTGGEQGLLSVAFAPDYPTSGLFYVAFTNRKGNVEIDEFRRSARNALRADPKSRRVVLRIPHPNWSNHNGGQLQFGPDGLLYISVGDGGGDTDGENARDLTSLLGKILRIDPRQKGEAPYRIPRDNPFVGQEGRRDEIFAYGLRNPWRFSFDGSNIAIADVGQTMREEVNILELEDARGSNFGWPQYEGDLLHDEGRPGPHPPVFPMHVYSHTEGRCAVVGGFVAHDESVPSLLGRYVYGDFCTAELFSFEPNVADQEALENRIELDLSATQLNAFGRGHSGELYVLEFEGTVSRVRPRPPL